MSGCPDDNTITALLEGRLTDDERRAVEIHCDGCPRCAQLLIELGRMTGASPAGVPEPMAERYRLLEPIGAGAMGVVFSAYDTKLSRKVAIKRLHDRGDDVAGKRQERRLRFLREAQLLASLSHPNVLTVHDLGTMDGELAVVMELIDGWSLSEWLTTCKPERRQVVEAFLAAGEGLAAAHRLGIIHRDVKPANILVARTGRVLMTDFGLAGLLPSSPGRAAAALGPTLDGNLGSITATGEILGTPAYMAPEQREGRLGDERSDQYAFCASLYEALHGQRFVAPAARDARPAPARDRGLRRVDRVLAIGLDRDASARFAGMEALLTALRAAAAPRRPAAVGLAAALLTVLLAASAWWGLGRESAPRKATAVAPRSSPKAAAISPVAGRPDAASAALRAPEPAAIVRERRASVSPGSFKSRVGDGGAMAAAQAALVRRDGAACIAALDEAARSGSAPGAAVLRGQCEMLRGHCDVGQRLLDSFYAEAKAHEEGSPTSRRRQVETLVREASLRFCPPSSFAAPTERYLAIHRQAKEARKSNDPATCRVLDRELFTNLPTTDLEAAYRTCQAYEKVMAPRARQALLEHEDVPAGSRPAACEEPRHAVALALAELGACFVASSLCDDGARHLMLSELVAHRDQPGSIDVTVAAAHVTRPGAREYPACAAAFGNLTTAAQRAQPSIDELAALLRRQDGPGRPGRAAELDRVLAGFGLRLLCGSGQDDCRIVPLFVKGG